MGGETFCGCSGARAQTQQPATEPLGTFIMANTVCHNGGRRVLVDTRAPWYSLTPAMAEAACVP